MPAIKVDRVPLGWLGRDWRGVDMLTLDHREWFGLTASDLEAVRASGVQIGLQINIFTLNLEAALNTVHSGQIAYLQIAYNQITSPVACDLIRQFGGTLQFSCSGIIADRDTDPAWIQASIERAMEAGYDLFVLDLYRDCMKPWRSLVENDGQFENELLLDDLIDLAGRFPLALDAQLSVADAPEFRQHFPLTIFNTDASFFFTDLTTNVPDLT